MARTILAYALCVGQLAMTAAFLSSPKLSPNTNMLIFPSSRSPVCSRRVVRPNLPRGLTQQRTDRAAAAPLARKHAMQQQQQQQQHAKGCAGQDITGLSSLESQNPGADDRSCGSGASRRPLDAPRLAVLTGSALAAGLAVAVLAPGPASAAVKAIVAGSEEEVLHVGQKVAQFFRRGGLPDWATLMAISAMPVVELRGGVPVGIWMGMPIAKVFGLCVAGNMIPIPVILLALRSPFVQKLAKPVLDRAREKAAGFGDEESQALALTLFVGIPLPGTGAWTGAMGAFLLGMPFQKAMLSIFVGVVSAGMIMSCLTLAGKAGALVATAILAVFCLSSILGGGKGGKNKASDFSSK